MFKENQVTLTSLIKKQSITACLILISVLFLGGCQEEQKPLAGYINDTWFEFPKDKYTFAASIKKHDDGKQHIDDVLWGYKYPSMEPLLLDFKMRGAFLDGVASGTDWIRVGTVAHDSSKAPDMLDDRLNIYLLNRIRGYSYTADPTPNEFGLYHASMKKLPDNTRKSKMDPPQNIYWYKYKDRVTALIYCTDYGDYYKGAACQNYTIDPVTGVELTFSYDSKNLPNWKDIHKKTLEILHSFIKK